MTSPQARLDLAARLGFLAASQTANSPFAASAFLTSNASSTIVQDPQFVPLSQSSDLSTSALAATPPLVPNSPLASNGTGSPSLVMKAYALALKSRMTVDSDLSLSSQAVFVANVQNKGIPLDVAKEYANEALYHHANAIQDGNQITFQSSRGDFFDYMNGYMLQVQDDELDDEKITPEIRAYTDLLRLTEKAYQRLLADFRGIKASDPDYKWQDHVAGPEGTEYRRYWAKRDEASAKLPDSTVVMALKIFDSSRARAESKQSQNMPCVLGDVNLGSPSRMKVDPKDIRYRPAYGLPGFENIATQWRDGYMQVINKPQRLDLDLKTAWETPWRTLGFPKFADASIAPKDLAALQGYRVSLTFTGMMPLRITRGLWNIEDFRDFTILRPDAPTKFKTPTFRTDMLLLAYGAQMRITIPDVTDQAPVVLPELLSGVNLNSQGNGVWVSDPPSNDAYPILLAALASKR